MSVKKNTTIIIILLAVVYFSLQVKYHYKVNGDYTIIQTEDTSDNKMSDYINTKYPIVINKTMNEEHLLFNLSQDIIQSICAGKWVFFNTQNSPLDYTKPSQVNIDIIPELVKNNNKWKYTLNHSFMKEYKMYQEVLDLLKPIQPKLSFNAKHCIIVSSKDYTEPLQYSEDYKIVFVQLSGTKLVRLFNPLQKKLVYIDDKFNPNYTAHSSIDIWEDHTKLYKRYPKLKETEFIDIILRPGNTLIIPNFWLFSTKNVDNSVTLKSNINTIFSHLVKIPTNLLEFSHEFGIYKNNSCYCHTH